MSETQKRVTIAVRITVAVTVDIDIVGGTVDVVRVASMSGLPSTTDVIEALDADGDMQQLDDAYVAAGGELP